MVGPRDTCEAGGGASNFNTGAGQQTNHNQSGNENRQYNAGTIHIYETQKQEFSKIASWLSRSDPWANHATARHFHQPETGAWLLQDHRYKKWKEGTSQHLWLHGKAGCGKTILCSTVIKDLQEHCQADDSVGLAIFYFSFSDDWKQSHDDVLRSLLAQLGWKEPAVTALRQAYDKPDRRVPGTDEVENILCLALGAYSRVYVALDALDECPKEDDVRTGVLEHVERLAQRVPNLKIFATSRELDDIRLSMNELRSEAVPVLERTVDSDIRKYLSTRLSSDPRFRRLKPESKTLIETQVAAKAEGMFRYAFLQLQEIRKLDSHRPGRIRNALDNLPKGLDETYSRILAGISDVDREDAVTLLRWLAYAKRPLTLRELVEVVLIDCDEKTVDPADRGEPEDALNILSGLVMIVRDHEDSDEDSIESKSPMLGELPPNDYQNSTLNELGLESGVKFNEDSVSLHTEIRLAHFSVKEYLESDRLVDQTKDFHLDRALGHYFLSRCCLIYIMYYSSSSESTFTEQDLGKFPLLLYAAETWYYHSSLHYNDDVSVETMFLTSDSALRHWLMVHVPDRLYFKPFWDHSDYCFGSGLYYASFLGLGAVVKEMLDRGADANADGGGCLRPLQAASFEGHFSIVQELLNNGANVNDNGYQTNVALYLASSNGYFNIVKELLHKGADVDAQNGKIGTALHAASLNGHFDTVKELLVGGANVNWEGGYHKSALQAASEFGSAEVVELLLDAGATQCGPALEEAVKRYHVEVVRSLLNKSMNISTEHYSEALEFASLTGQIRAVELLLDSRIKNGTECHGRGFGATNKSTRENTEVDETLSDKSVVVSRVDYGAAFSEAARGGELKVVMLMLDRGIDISSEGYGGALWEASLNGHSEVVKVLLDRGLDITDDDYADALYMAKEEGYDEIVKLLTDKGAQERTSTIRK